MRQNGGDGCLAIIVFALAVGTVLGIVVSGIGIGLMQAISYIWR